MDLRIHLVVLFSFGCLATGGYTSQVPTCQCFHIYRPVCADDGRTYGNHCEVVCQGVNVVSRGSCPLPEIAETKENDEEEHSLTSDVMSEFSQDGTPRSPGTRFPGTRSDCVCPFSFHPVCGADGRTYPNLCGATCRGVGVDHEGRCRRSEAGRGQLCACPPIRSPVCGEDGATYQNACVARCRGVEIASREPCTGSLTDTSAHARCECPRIKRPVCGTNGRTYANECLATCNDQEVAHQGVCDQQRELCICNMRFRPVCAENGRTYPNPCRARCEGQGFTVGACRRQSQKK